MMDGGTDGHWRRQISSVNTDIIETVTCLADVKTCLRAVVLVNWWSLTAGDESTRHSTSAALEWNNSRYKAATVTNNKRTIRSLKGQKQELRRILTV